MKTIILNGSPRPQGDTAALISALRQTLPGEITQIDAYREKIAPCTDCRRCWEKPGCIFDDGMNAVLDALIEADCIILASPVYFSSLPGPLLTLCSRLQILYTSARFHGKRLISAPKVGGILLCGGGEGSPAPAEASAKAILRALRTEVIDCVLSGKTDHLPACRDEVARSAAEELGRKIAARLDISCRNL